MLPARLGAVALTLSVMTMKRALCLNVCAAALMLSLTGVGCKKPQKPVTNIPPRAARVPESTRPKPADTGLSPGGTLPGGTTQGTDAGTRGSNLPETGSGLAQAGMGEFEGMLTDTNAFAAATVYFDFDSSVVKTTNRRRRIPWRSN